MNDRRKAGRSKNERHEAVYGVMTPENIGRLAGGIAHDLNTILTTIYAYCEQALESAEPLSETEHSITMIISAADKARALTAQLLNLRLGNDQDKSIVKLNDIVSDTLNFIRPSVSENVKIVRRLASGDIFVIADPVQLFRVFLNLAINALQAMGKDGGKLTVVLKTVNQEAGAEEQGPGSALVRFSDTGRGMNRATSSRMFEPFFTTDNAGRGTGLGLAIVREIINTINGDIRVVSEPGAGTVIDVLIPLTDTAEGNLGKKKAAVNKQ
jgi:signal transduction histidine kinase